MNEPGAIITDIGDAHCHLADLADRRHWHTGCWNARERRGPAPFRRP